MNTSQISVEIGGIVLQPGKFQSFGNEREATMTIRLVNGCESDKKLSTDLAGGGVVGESVEAGPVSFAITRARRIVDSQTNAEAVWEIWD